MYIILNTDLENLQIQIKDSLFARVIIKHEFYYPIIQNNVKTIKSAAVIMSSTKIFASRTHILAWINKVLQIPINKIQQLGSGVVYCLLLDAAFPNRVPLHKLKWFGNTQVEYLHNFKILQTSFVHLGIDKKIEITRLVKAKHQDNLQFIQWMKWYLQDTIASNYNYDPMKRRNCQNVYLQFYENKILRVPHSIYNNKISSLPKNQRKSKKRSYQINNDYLEIQNLHNMLKGVKTVQSETDFFSKKNKWMSQTVNTFGFTLHQINKEIQQQNSSDKENKDKNILQGQIQTLQTPKHTMKRLYFPQRFSERLLKKVNLKEDIQIVPIKIQQQLDKQQNN